MSAPWFELANADCREALRELPENSIDAVVTDPPYDLTSGKKGGSGTASVNLESPYGRARIGTGNGVGGFMGMAWDATGVAFEPATWREVYRVLKPGGHLLSFGGTRTYHRMACAIEDAGFEVRDMIEWVYGTGFPKSMDVSKAIDKAAGAERAVVGTHTGGSAGSTGGVLNMNGRDTAHGSARASREVAITAPATEAAEDWAGWGTALKPAQEPICVARKPLSEGTVAANVLRWGTGALNIDASRVAFQGEVDQAGAKPQGRATTKAHGAAAATPDAGRGIARIDFAVKQSEMGRWPANLVHDGSEEVLGCFPESSITGKRTAASRAAVVPGTTWLMDNHESREYTDSGTAARFFYCAKAAKSERGVGNGHPTVKPLALMGYLCGLVTPPGGVVLDPFMGSGTTGLAALQRGFNFIGVELDAGYLEIARARIEHPAGGLDAVA